MHRFALRPDVTSPFVALDRHHEPIIGELREAFERVVTGSSFILGEEVEEFEREFAVYCEARSCVGVASGTAALTLALIAAGIGRGDEVIVPAHTYIATALSVVHAGAEPAFCDVEPGTGLVDIESAASVVSSRTAAIIAVHLYGQTCDMDAVNEFASRHGLFVLEDAAQAHGATFNGRRAGSLGSAAAFSFYPSKNLGALGDGGAVCTSNHELSEKVRQLRHLGQRRKGEHVLAGFNERLDGLQAALLRVKLAHLDAWNARRRKLAGLYRALLDGHVELLEERSASPCVYHLFPVRVPARELVIERLSAAGVGVAVHYTPAVHEQPPFAFTTRGAPTLDNATRWAREELSLPMYPELDAEEASNIATAVIESVAHIDAFGPRPSTLGAPIR